MMLSTISGWNENGNMYAIFKHNPFGRFLGYPVLWVCEQCPNVKDDSEGNFISADIEKGIQDGNSSGGHYEEEKVARGDDVIVDLDATLEDLYMGGSLKKLVIGVKATCFDLLPKFDKVMTDHHIYFITSYSKGTTLYRLVL
ncbi:hypothetical protein E3N88_08949 [Mikania micrantha]|uniref:Uncharacterized protein n=1 Tax=Mikania micrantha TaxID=192012 RepID=A0A5N6PK05_9ASTR|nr:hypothetical protein E3N88_08949 [Mikania micrantha]